MGKEGRTSRLSVRLTPEEYKHSNYASQYVGGHDHA